MSIPRVPPFLDAPHSEVRQQWAAEVLDRYFFGRVNGATQPRFSGAMFEKLDGGGDRDAVRDCFTSADVVASSLLSVSVPGDAAVRLLCTDAADLSELLARIPPDLSLADAEDSTLTTRSPATDLWVRVKSFHGIGPTRTSKLLARKRPHLLPIWDSRINALLGLGNNPHDYWRKMRDLLGPSGSDRNEFLRVVRDRAGLSSGVSVIRVFDVLCWMFQSGYTNVLPAPDSGSSDHDH